MKVTIISYEKVFPLAQFVNEKIGIQIQVDDTESPEAALDLARKTVHEWHEKNNPHLFEVNKDVQHYEAGTIKASVQNKKLPVKTSGNPVIDQINQSSSVEVLKSFELIVRHKPDLQAAYDEKMKQLLATK